MTPLHRIFLLAALLCAAVNIGSVRAIAQGDKQPAEKPQSAPEKPKTPPDKPATGARTGSKDRWAIKTASDVEAEDIDRKPVKSTIEKLLAIPRPLDMPLDGSNAFFQEHRARPAETSVFSVEADVIDCRLMPDGDYRVTVRGASGKTVVLEMPNPTPEFVDPKSKFAGDIKTARGQFDKKFQPEKAVKALTGHARITGVGFFGRTYGNKKAEGNLIQLHPVLNIEWLDKPTVEFTAPKYKTEPGSGKPAPTAAPDALKPTK